MISQRALVRALEHERYRLKLAKPTSEFMNGMVTGLSLALALIHKMWAETRHQLSNNQKYRRGF